MGRAEQRRRARSGGDGTRGKRRPKRPFWILGLSVAAAFLVLAVASQQGSASSHHPSPRVVELAPDVVPAARYAELPRVAEVYSMAAAVPQVLDGMYCHCDCSKHSSHYSLLDCFSTDHGARCDICMSEAALAYQMTADGADLDAIRAAIDQTYGT